MIEFAPHDLTSNTSHAPFVASASTNATGDYGAWKAFNGSLSGYAYWQTSNGNPTGWLKLDLGSGITQTLLAYQFGQAAKFYQQAEPKDWTLEGSNDDSTWDVLDTVTGETGWVEGEIRGYFCDVTTTAYRYFRLNVTANNGYASRLTVGEIYLYEAGGATPGVRVTQIATEVAGSLPNTINVSQHATEVGVAKDNIIHVSQVAVEVGNFATNNLQVSQFCIEVALLTQYRGFGHFGRSIPAAKLRSSDGFGTFG